MTPGYLTGGFWANAQWCRDNGIPLHVHRAMHAVLDRHPRLVSQRCRQAVRTVDG